MTAQPRRKHDAQFPLRLLSEQMDRVEKIARRKGKSVSDYIRDALMRALNDDETFLREEKDRRESELERAFVPRPPGSRGRPRGLGLREAGWPPQEPEAPPPPPAPTVIVNNTPTTDDLAPFIKHIAETEDSFERTRRKDAAMRILRSTITDETRLATIEKTIDERVAAIAPPKKKYSWLTGG